MNGTTRPPTSWAPWRHKSVGACSKSILRLATGIRLSWLLPPGRFWGRCVFEVMNPAELASISLFYSGKVPLAFQFLLQPGFDSPGHTAAKLSPQMKPTPPYFAANLSALERTLQQIRSRSVPQGRTSGIGGREGRVICLTWRGCRYKAKTKIPDRENGLYFFIRSRKYPTSR